jgi:hypothetical protein
MKAGKIALRFGFGLILLSGMGIGAPKFEAEVDSSGGSTVGGWTCGPAARVNYAGLHGRVQVSERRRHDENGPGFTAELGAAAESQNIQLITARCDENCSPSQSDLPPDRVMWAGNLRGGYRTEDIGFLLGWTLYQGWMRHTDDEPRLGWCPDIEFTFGPRSRWYVVAGLGSGPATTIHRPGLYFGGGVGSNGYRLELLSGVHRQGPRISNFWTGDYGRRVSLTGWAPLSPNVDLRLGSSLDLEPGPGGGEGSVGARFYF